MVFFNIYSSVKFIFVWEYVCIAVSTLLPPCAQGSGYQALRLNSKSLTLRAISQMAFLYNIQTVGPNIKKLLSLSSGKIFSPSSNFLFLLQTE